MAAAATQLDFSDDNTASSLPADTATRPPTTATNTVTQETTSTATTATGTTSSADDLDRGQAAGHGRRAPPREAQRERRARRTARHGPARQGAGPRPGAASPCASTRPAATFLCVEGDGKQLFNGTLSGARTFRARVVRLNIGLGPSTRLTANGKVVPLTASPTGLELTPKRRTLLPLGSRPCA